MTDTSIMEASNDSVLEPESSLETNTSEDNTKGVEVRYMSLAGWSWTTVEKFYAIMGFVLLSVMARLLFHRMKLLSSRVPESCLLIIVGVIFGGFLYLVHDCSLHPECQESQQKIFPEFTPTLFFYKLLPPIILDA